MELDVRFPSVCDLYLDGRLAESCSRSRGESETIIIEHAIVSESSSAPFLFSPIVITGKKKGLLLSA